MALMKRIDARKRRTSRAVERVVRDAHLLEHSIQMLQPIGSLRRPLSFSCLLDSRSTLSPSLSPQRQFRPCGRSVVKRRRDHRVVFNTPCALPESRLLLPGSGRGRFPELG